MGVWTLIILIALAWLSYAIAGLYSVGADVAEGKRPKGAGFSFLLEWLVFPAAFFGFAALIDHFAMPWGRLTIGGVCAAMLAVHTYVLLRSRHRIRSAQTPPHN